MKILIADDERELAGLIQHWLVRKGHEVDVALDGSQALELLKIHSYHLALLDLSLPEVTGLELLDFLKNNHPTTRTVMITGYALAQDSLLKAAGIDEYLPKPFSFEALEQIVLKYQPKKT